MRQGWAWTWWLRSSSPLMPSSRYRSSYVCTLWRLTPYRSATSVTGTPAPTSSTARYLCSATLNSHSMSGSVKHQAKPMCQASSGTAQTDVVQSVRTFFTSSRARGARRARWPPRMQKRRAASARGLAPGIDCQCSPEARWGPLARVKAPALPLLGPGRATAAAGSHHTHVTASRTSGRGMVPGAVLQADPRGAAKAAIAPVPDPEALRVRGQRRSLRSRLRMRKRHP